MLAHRFGPDLDDGINEVLTEVQAHDSKLLKGMNDGITENENLITWETDVNEVLDIADELTIAQVAVFNSMEGHSFRNNVASKLDALVSLEMAASQNIRNRMVSAVKTEVQTLFATNKTAKENAMNQAIAILTAGPSAKMGKDVVGEAFGVAVKNYQESYSKLPAGTDDIILSLEKDMAAIVTPVKFEVTGGNVFETNLIRM
jgi:Mitochondrial ATP synthase B chain precursor (ATP-synt_B)